MTSDSRPLVSVLTPVRNGEAFVRECIESVLAQTYQNWEYIIVNNCSTDGTAAILEEYRRADARITVASNETVVRAQENHNIAIARMSPDSQYCKFVHADDWLFPECLEKMVSLAESNPSVGVVGAYGILGARVRWDGLPFPSTVVSGREVCRRSLLGGFYVFGSPTSHLFRSSFVSRRRPFYLCDEYMRPYADQEAIYDMLRYSDFGFVHQVLSFSREHEGSESAAFARTGLNTDFPAALGILTQYGKIYLNSSEYQHRLRAFERRYYSFLCHSIFRDKRFWNFHKQALRQFDRPLKFASFLATALSEAANIALMSPQLLASRLANKAAGFRNASRADAPDASKYPPAKSVALDCEPLKAAGKGLSVSESGSQSLSNTGS